MVLRKFVIGAGVLLLVFSVFAAIQQKRSHLAHSQNGVEASALPETSVSADAAVQPSGLSRSDSGLTEAATTEEQTFKAPPIPARSLGNTAAATARPAATTPLPVEGSPSLSSHDFLADEPRDLSTSSTGSRPTTKGSSPNFWMWFVAGGGLLSASQTSSGIGSLDFDQMIAPTLRFTGGFYFTNSLAVDFTYRTFSGEVRSSESIAVSGGSYSASDLNAELLIEDFWNQNPRASLFRLRLGARLLGRPFLVPRSPTQTSVLDSSSVHGVLGFDHHYPFRNLIIQTQLKYELPLSSSASGGSLTYSPEFAFGGSFGAVYAITKNFKTGIFFTGEWQQQSFDYSDPGLTLPYAGSLRRLQGAVEFRTGLEF